MPERNVGITFLDNDYTVASVREGQYISMLALIQEIGDTLLETMDTVVLLDDVGEDSFEIRERHGYFNVEGHSHLFVKHYWKNKKESLLDQVELSVRDMMLSRKSKKARPSAPSEWTGNVGYSTRALGNFGFCSPAPFSKGLGINDSCLVGKKDRELFNTVQNLLLEKYPIFANIFAQAGRIDLKYNSSIKEADNHIDGNDKCHQVIFTVGLGTEPLLVKEDIQIESVQCHRDLVAFDGRFQHWVGEYQTPAFKDRIAVVCYLVDLPESYKHPRKTMRDIARMVMK